MYKKADIMKEIDAIGRIVIPKEFRERLGLKGLVEIVLTREGVVIRSPYFELVEKERS